MIHLVLHSSEFAFNFFNIATEKTCSESAINVCMYVFLYVYMNDCRPTFIEDHNSLL